MTLCELYIGIFAGVEDRRISFNNDITIIYGPNEAGKSTIFYAILHTLLTPVNLSNQQLNKEMKRFVPLGSEKPMQTSLRIRVEEKLYRIDKQWPKVRKEEKVYQIDKQWPGQLQLWDEESGRCIGNEQESIDALFPAPRATIRHLGLQTQQETTDILEHLSEKKSLANNLTDFFRATVFTPVPGFSLERFQQILVQRIEEHYGRWDEEADRPQQGRRSWKRGVGTILETYNRWKELEDGCRNFIELEEKLNLIRQRSRDIAQELAVKTTEEKNLQGKVTLLLKREKERSDYEKREEKLIRLKKLRLSWPELSGQITALQRKIVTAETTLMKLEEEHSQSLKKEQIPNLRFRFAEEKKRQEAFEKLEKEYRTLKVPSDELITEARTLNNQCQQIRMKMEKGSIRMYLTAKKPLEVELSHALSDLEKVKMAEKETVQKRNLSFLVVETDQISIRVEEDSIDVPKLTRELESNERQLSQLLTEHDCQSLDEAIERQQRKILLKEQIDAIRREGEEAVSEISRQLKSLETLPARPLAEVATDQGSLWTKLQLDREGLQHKKKGEEELIREFQSVENLHKITDQLISQPFPPPMPEEDIASMEDSLQKLRQSVNELREQQKEIIAESARMEAEFQSLAKTYHSREDLEKERNEALQAVKWEKHIASSLKIIQQETNKIVQESQERELQAYHQEFIDAFAEIGDRFQLEFHGVMPTLRRSGESLDFRWLSEGMKEIFALIVRLLCARVLLKRNCFILFDDPLVSLDAERHQIALKAIKEFSFFHQIVFFTCHKEPLELSDGFLELFRRV